MKRKVSLKDIANRVGVSTALVSYVLNGLEKEKRVGAEVVARIREAARDLNYTPNQIARSLRRGLSNTIGLIVADIANPFFAHLSRIIEDEAARHSYVVLIGSSDEDYTKSGSLIETFLNRQVDGFVIVPSEGCLEQIKALVQREIPMVLVDRYLPGLSTNYIALDNYRATYEAVSHLTGKGYRKITLVAYKSSLIHMQERIRGYREAMKAHAPKEEVRICEMDYRNVQSEMEKTVSEIAETRNAEALLFATNALSVAGLYAIRKHRLNVPAGVAVIGFDGSEAFDFFDPPLTYIRQPLEEIGKESVRVLLDQIKGEGREVHVNLAHQLVERDSCGGRFA